MQNVACVILAAGKGKRMKSDLPKVLHLLDGKPLVEYVLASCKKAGVARTVVVVGFKGDLVTEVVKPHGAETVIQQQQLGTGHAVAQTEPLLKNHTGEILVMNGDVPLISPRSIESLVEEHRRRGAVATVLTAELDDPTGYGRIVRTSGGLVESIVEEADADIKIKAIREINSGMFCFDPGYLFTALHRVDNENQQGEYYLTDVLRILRHDNHPVAAQKINDANEVLGVNSPEQLKLIAGLPVKH